MTTKISISIKSILFISLILFTTTTSRAQYGEEYLPRQREQIPPSPTSKVYTRYPGYKPDISTGAMSLSIPLYTATEQELSIPLALNYYSNGVKVMENNFPLGYSWTLTPGLRITRTVMGKADENSDFEVKHNSYTYEYLWNIYSRDGSKDASTDIFTIHLPGHSFPFLLKKENEVWKAAIPNSSLKITPLFTIYKELEGFSVLDEKGVTYKFGGQYIEKDSESGNSTAWMLYQILLPGSSPNQIDISWSKYAATCNAERIYNDYFMFHDNYLESLEEPGMQGPGFETYQGESTYDYDIQNLFLPKQIKMPSQTIDFTYEITGDRPFLTDIVVKDARNAEIKRCGMGYSNSGTLSGLYVSGEGTYKFEYYGGEYMDTRSQDLWGYYNGKNNVTLIPGFRVRIESFSSRIYEHKGADRSTDATAMQNFMLKKITYPTQGYMQIEYEPHQFKKRKFSDIFINGSYDSYLTEGGGVRVKKTTSCAGNDAPEIIRNYKYGANENGEGRIVDAPELRWFINEQFYYHSDSSVPYLYDLAFRQLLIGGTASTVANFTNNPNIWYPIVTEYEGGDKTVSYFEFLTNTSSVLWQGGYANAYGIYPPFYIANYGNLAQKGALLKKKVIFKKGECGYVPVEKNEYEYDSYGSPECSNVGNALSSRLDATIDSGNGDLSVDDSKAVPGSFWAGDYWISLREYWLHKKKRTLYQGEDSIVTETVSDSRVQDDRVNLTHCTKFTDSRGDTYFDYLYYLCDSEINDLLSYAQRLAVSALKNDNRITVPLVHIRKKEDKELFRKVIQYKNFGNRLLLPEKEFYSQDSGNEEERIVYQKYDGKGNLQGVVQDGIVKTVYLWGYNSLHPVAKIEGATYDEVQSWLTLETINDLEVNVTPEAALSSIRNKLADKNVLTTTYIYKPLVGMTSVTTPNGETTTYEYDNSGRLIKVKDHNGKTVEQYDYNYKKQLLK